MSSSNDLNDPNHTSSNHEENKPSSPTSPTMPDSPFPEYRKKISVIVEEYFETDDILAAAIELRELRMPTYNYYFVKKLVSMAMDRHDKEKEMAAVLLSSLYADVIDPPQVYKGFCKLVETADDLIVDIPDTVDILASFIARAVIDDILPPSFLTKEIVFLSKESKGVDVIQRAGKGYLSGPHHAEKIERRWGGNKTKTVENVKSQITNLLMEYIVSGDKKEAFRCIKDLNVPFFHHEIVKRALIIAMEKRQAEDQLLDLLKLAAEEGLLNSSQVSKGFSRIIDHVDDLSLDIPNAKEIFQSLIWKAASEGWLSASSLKSLPISQPETKSSSEDSVTKEFKTKAQSFIKEYFLTGDILEVCQCLESEHTSPKLNAIFVKRLITIAMDRKNREKEMASVFLSSLCIPPDDMVSGFLMLIEAADDAALDIPVIAEDLAMFLARAVVDEVITPQHLEEIESQCVGAESLGNRIIPMAKSLLNARLSGERILRCWGGGGSSKNGWAVEDVKDKIEKLLEEFEAGGDIKEACRCIKELGMAFFHHEVVKKSLVMILEKKNDKLWLLLKECFSRGLITTNQMMKGFGRMDEAIDDLALDVPGAEQQFLSYVQRAKDEGWLDQSFNN
ncbi:MA3 DOMAIN-CONTAINING TRANSLATION REGULATORY FACTOR 2 [Impatiens glandulifera]|uniref:MA3 DOMAIN-CONTAINING TRANSLATION REGULATORY FACTOR 2 n=1 Tax=Impatiens glandulifera TaxID=253017 RepID=UPI001FB0749B|nr:MA3 DOMAIN-CONTAINING TRANSLATION REGULATORY FACTOR 2 [Impatiens glandulifera]